MDMESQKLRLVRILRSTVMVRVGGGWVALDEFLIKNDPVRGEHCSYLARNMGKHEHTFNYYSSLFAPFPLNSLALIRVYDYAAINEQNADEEDSRGWPDWPCRNTSSNDPNDRLHCCFQWRLTSQRKQMTRK